MNPVPSSAPRGAHPFVRLMSGAVADQALLSAASFVVGLLLIRHTSELQYGYYILATNAFLLATSLQNAFIGPPLVTRVTRLAPERHAGLLGGLYREQRQPIVLFSAAAIALVLLAWSFGALDDAAAPVLLAGVAAAVALLYREYFRIVLLAYRRPTDVLIADLPYIALLLIGAWLATQSSLPAATAVATMGLAAAICGRMLLHRLRREQAFDPRGGRGILREIAPIGLWSVSGAAIHWTFSQGYSYLVAATLDVAAVAAIAATRLLMMPVNLLSNGIRSLMLPLASGWLHRHGPATTLRRLCLFAAALAAASLCYFALMWVMRDWIFAEIMQKNFAGRDRLLLMWSAIFLLMVVRDQIIMLAVARERFRTLSSLTLASALLALACSYWGMLQYGQFGALLGMFVGEAANLAGVIWLALREQRVLAHTQPASVT